MNNNIPINGILDLDSQDLPVVRVVVAAAEGSAPRETGAAMLVDKFGSTGTIGGGQLEFEAIEQARAMLPGEGLDHTAWFRELHTYPLGPKLAQCCGGMVRLLFERFGPEEVDALRRKMQMNSETAGPSLIVRETQTGAPILCCDACQQAHELPVPVAGIITQILSGERASEPMLVDRPGFQETYFVETMAQPRMPLFIYGAGHVGRAIVKIAADLPFQIFWVDTHEHRFPHSLPDNVERVVARDPAMIATSSPRDALHLVLTYSHAIDLAICRALLQRPLLRFLGLIGSATKRARFMKRLRDGGISSEALSRLTCPIGISGLAGKSPTTIAVSVAAQLIEQLEQARDVGRQDNGGGREPDARLSA